MKVWIKWTSPWDETKTPEWTLHDIDNFELKKDVWYSGGTRFYKQCLHYEWKSDTGHGTEEIDLKDYPPLASKEHLIILCNIERPYIEGQCQNTENSRQEDLEIF